MKKFADKKKVPTFASAKRDKRYIKSRLARLFLGKRKKDLEV